MVKHRATCVKANFGIASTAGSVNFHYILAASKQEKFL